MSEGVDNKTGLLMMGFILQSIALKGDEKDMLTAAKGVSHIDENIIMKYFDDAKKLKESMVYEFTRLGLID